MGSTRPRWVQAVGGALLAAREKKALAGQPPGSSPPLSGPNCPMGNGKPGVEGGVLITQWETGNWGWLVGSARRRLVQVGGRAGCRLPAARGRKAPGQSLLPASPRDPTHARFCALGL